VVEVLAGVECHPRGKWAVPIGGLYELLDRCSRVLVMTSPSFDFQAQGLPPNVRYVGPQLDDPDWAATGDWRPGGDGRLVLVAMSSIFQDQRTRCAGSQPDWVSCLSGRL
jgi:hypothetical protein